MKVLRYFVAAIAFLLLWFLVAVGIGLLTILLFPPTEARTPIGIAFDPRNLPGTLVGFVVALLLVRAFLRHPRGKRLAE
jgi:hypothetical protein